MLFVWCGEKPKHRLTRCCGQGYPLGIPAWKARESNDPESDALLCIECRDSGIHWMQPGDFDVGSQPMNDGSTIREYHGPFRLGNGCGGIHIIFCGSLRSWYLARTRTPISTIQKFLRLDDARQFDRDAELKTYRNLGRRGPLCGSLPNLARTHGRCPADHGFAIHFDSRRRRVSPVMLSAQFGESFSQPESNSRMLKILYEPRRTTKRESLAPGEQDSRVS